MLSMAIVGVVAMDGNNLRQWFGVEVSMGHVVALELPTNSLSGRLPGGSLERLPKLLVLDLSKNQLQGEIPTELQRFDGCYPNPDCFPTRRNTSKNFVHKNSIIRYSIAPSLQEIHLYENSLSGTMPMQLGKLHNLRTLQLQHKNLCGALPDTLCELIQLSKVSVRGNNLTGCIPTDIGHMQSLVFLSLRNNELTGVIPSSLGSCKALEFLDLSSSQLSGPILESLGKLENLYRVPGSIARLKFLKESDFRDNRLCGELPNFLDGCPIFEAVMTKWKNRKAIYRHSPLGDPMPSFNMLPTSTHQFLQTLEDSASSPSTIILSLNFGHKTSAYDDGFLEKYSANNSFLITIFSQKRHESVA
ncbi:hypothetical protein PsorP6_012014 [Peronosclerospora sorghi]|uniref:Uncharacterized protein n=1 Tax=Peronosclerospora sorghi TaxID=230839 RepID=A0ACC0WJ99_9STRA|nr:hypothetical protein PsorP6_012014 [Peronosclerospora sorghi]